MNLLRDEIPTEFSILQELQKVSVQLISGGNERILHNQILSTARALMHADFASMQTYHATTDELILMANHGFHPEAAEIWKYISLGASTTCGQAALKGCRVINQDLEDPALGLTLKQLRPFRLSGIRSCQSTPLISRKGDFIGMISTHWGKVHQPTESELQVFDILVRQAADLIEHYNFEQKLQNSTQQLYQILNQSPYGVNVIEGKNFILTFANQHWLDMVQKDRSCIGKPVFKTLPHANGKGREDVIRDVIKTGKPVRGNEVERQIFRNGKLETAYFNFVYAPYRNSDHVVTGVICIVEEVTEKVISRQRKEESEIMLRNLMQKANIVIIMFSGPDFVVEAINEQGSEILGKGEADVVNRKLENIGVRNYSRLKKILQTVYETGNPYREEEISTQFIRKLKHYYGYFNFSFEPILDGNQKITGVLCIGMEITEQVLARLKIVAR